MDMTTEQRFWSKVNKAGDCWEWTGAIAGRYGQFSNMGKIPAHRFSWALHFGEIPEGLFVLHHCDNPICVRPDHLFTGTASDNMRDMIRKHGHPKRRNSFRAKLSGDAVRSIRSSAESTYVLAKRYGVESTTIGNVRMRKTWGDLE